MSSRKEIPIARQIRTVKSLVRSFEAEMADTQDKAGRDVAMDTVECLLATLKCLQQIERGEQEELF